MWPPAPPERRIIAPYRETPSIMPSERRRRRSLPKKPRSKARAIKLTDSNFYDAFESGIMPTERRGRRSLPKRTEVGSTRYQVYG